MKKFTTISVLIILTASLFAQTDQYKESLQRENVNKLSDTKSEFIKEPYLIFEGINTQMRVIWQLNETSTSEIYWGTDSTYNLGNASTTEYGDDHQHGYTITGLTPGAKYYYKVITTDTVHKASFRAAPDATETSLNFFMFGDTRTQYMVQDTVSAAMIADYQNDSTFQTISICTGDLVTYGAFDPKWQSEFFNNVGQNTLKRLAELPFISCLGNHELYYNNYSGVDMTTALFGKYFPYPYVERRYWSFDYGPVHFTIIDLYPDYYDPYGQGFVDEDQLDWIENDLNSTQKDWKIVVLHEPGWSAGGSSSGVPHPNNEDVQNLLQPLFEQYGVQMVQCGHNHYYARAVKNGILHLTAAGGGAPLYAPDPGYPNVMKTSETHHYCKAQINDSTLLITVLTPDGDTVDQISLLQNFLPGHLLGFLSKEVGPGNISDVMIEIDSIIIHPDSIGYYGLELEPGIYDVTFSLLGYDPISEQVEIIAGTETQLDTIMNLYTGLPGIKDNSVQFLISPNPSNGISTISYKLNEKESITISIRNISGQEVKQISLGVMDEGQVDIDCSGYSQGIYFVNLQTDNGIITKKLIIQ